jgi:hypothetical protein
MFCVVFIRLYAIIVIEMFHTYSKLVENQTLWFINYIVIALVLISNAKEEHRVST